MISLLTSIIGVVAKGKAAKAIAGGLSGAILNGAGPVYDAFAQGFQSGIVPPVNQLGAALGSLVAGYLVGHIIVWLSPANKTG